MSKDSVVKISVPELELMVCPFCGGKAEIRRAVIKGEITYHVSCASTKCQCSVQACAIGYTAETAVKAWNRRANDGTKENRADS